MKIEGNVLILTHWSFKDALVQTYTLPYVDIIRKIIPPEKKIFVVTFEQERVALNEEEKETLKKGWEKRNMQLLALSYKKFGIKKLINAIKQLLQLAMLIRKEHISVIHAFCTPAGSIGYLLSKLTGAKLIIDSYEPHAESMVEAGAWKKSGGAFKILFRLEKKLAQHAVHIIATTAGMKEYAKEKYNFDLKNFFVKPACIDFNTFFPRPKNELLLQELKLADKIVGVYAGKLGGMYLNEEVFDFIKSCYEHWGDRFRFLILTPEPDEKITKQMQRIGIPAGIVIKRFVFHKGIPDYLSLGDFGINPQTPVPSKRYGSPLKNGEYWGMGLPIVISPKISIDSDIIIANNIGVVINLQKKENMTEAVKQLDQLLKNNSRESLQQKIFSVAKKHRSFQIAEEIYPVVYER
jgi:glycosyltransferase involved in cell wall biosynthesis